MIPKVLFLPKWYPNKYDTQLGIFIQKHAKAVAKYCKVAVLYVLPDPTLTTDFQVVESKEKGFLEVIIYYKKNEAKAVLKRHPVSGWRYFRAHRKGLDLIAQQFGQADIVHVHVMKRPCLVAYYLKMTKKIPYCITEHWSGYITGKFRQKNKFSQWLTRQLVQKAEAVTAVSEKLKTALLENGFQRVDYIVPNVVETKTVKSTALEAQINEGKTLILTVADLDDSIKNVSDVLRAIAYLKSDLPPLTYHIIGGGKDEVSLRQLATDLDLMDKWVVFHGRKNNDYVLNFLQKIDFLILNSNFETFSVVTAESLASGKPVIATRCGGPEQFITPQTGLLIEPRNRNELQEAIMYMVNNYQNYDSQTLKDSIQQNYSSSVVGQQFCDIYKSIIG